MELCSGGELLGFGTDQCIFVLWSVVAIGIAKTMKLVLCGMKCYQSYSDGISNVGTVAVLPFVSSLLLPSLFPSLLSLLLFIPTPGRLHLGKRPAHGSPGRDRDAPGARVGPQWQPPLEPKGGRGVSKFERFCFCYLLALLLV